MEDSQKDVLKHVNAVMETSEARLYDQVNTSFNWLLGTLFAANGGAIVALVSRETSISTVSLGLFAAGVICSILMGFANAAYAAKAIMPTTDIRMTLALLEAGEASIQQLEDKMKALEGITWLKWPMYGAGVLSLTFLIGGMISFACIL
ncbi:MAG TPA: hypothetical protein VL094_05965 [Sphingomonadaceae bacterium]|nr:hypothetical protein [Sphingomonadaceae bacterium]